MGIGFGSDLGGSMDMLVDSGLEEQEDFSLDAFPEISKLLGRDKIPRSKAGKRGKTN